MEQARLLIVLASCASVSWGACSISSSYSSLYWSSLYWLSLNGSLSSGLSSGSPPYRGSSPGGPCSTGRHSSFRGVQKEGSLYQEQSIWWVVLEVSSLSGGSSTRWATEVGEWDCWGAWEAGLGVQWVEKPQNMYVGSFQTSSIALENAEGFKSGGLVTAGSCCVSLWSGGTGVHSVVGGGDFDKWEFEYTVKTGSTLELSPECLEISVRQDLASVTQRGAL